MSKRLLLEMSRYIVRCGTFTVEADEGMGILETYQQCAECDQLGPVPGVIVHKPDCIVGWAQRAGDALIACGRCEGVGSVRVEISGYGSAMRRCPDCEGEGVKSPPKNGDIMQVTDEMVNRFLSWKLPDDFAPDAGIEFTPPSHWPTGTNLFTAEQARAMLEHCHRGSGMSLTPRVDDLVAAIGEPLVLRHDIRALIAFARAGERALFTGNGTFATKQPPSHGTPR